MSEYIVKDTELTSIANAIRTKTGGNGQLEFPSGFVSAIGSIGGNLRWELIGETTFEWGSYTDTTAWQTKNTGINIKNTDYVIVMTVITCDGQITTSSEWGMTISFGGRYTSNSSYLNHINICEKGSQTLSFSGLVTNTNAWPSYGVCVQNNTNDITIERKAHETACPLIRGGNYKVSVYGLAGI